MLSDIYNDFDDYSGNGTLDTFDFTFPILAKADLVVWTRVVATGVKAELVLDTDFTIPNADVGIAAGGGTITTTVAVATGTKIYLGRKTTRTQLVNITEGFPFSTAAVMLALDRLTMMIQEHDEQLSRCIRFHRTSDSQDIFMPDPGTDGQVLKWLSSIIVNGTDNT